MKDILSILISCFEVIETPTAANIIILVLMLLTEICPIIYKKYLMTLDYKGKLLTPLP